MKLTFISKDLMSVNKHDITIKYTKASIDGSEKPPDSLTRPSLKVTAPANEPSERTLSVKNIVIIKSNIPSI